MKTGYVKAANTQIIVDKLPKRTILAKTQQDVSMANGSRLNSERGQVTLLLPIELKKALYQQADANDRSVNKEAARIFEAALRPSEQSSARNAHA